MQIITKISQFFHLLLTAELQYQKRKEMISLMEGFDLTRVFSTMDTFKKNSLRVTFLRNWIAEFGYTLDDQEFQKFLERWFKLGASGINHPNRKTGTKYLSKLEKFIFKGSRTSTEQMVQENNTLTVLEKSRENPDSLSSKPEQLHEITRNHLVSRQSHIKSFSKTEEEQTYKEYQRQVHDLRDPDNFRHLGDDLISNALKQLEFNLKDLEKLLKKVSL